MESHKEQCARRAFVLDIHESIPEPKPKVRITGVSIYALSLEAQKPGFIKFLMREIGNPEFPVDCEVLDHNNLSFPKGIPVKRHLFTEGPTEMVFIEQKK